MPSFDSMKDTIFDVINGLSLVADKAIDFQYQNSPPPGKPYFSLMMTSFAKIGRDTFTAPDDSGKSTMLGNRQFVLMILGFGSGIVEATYKLQSQLEVPSVYKAMVDGGVMPYDVDQPVQDISGLDDSENEERSSYDVLCRTDSVITNVPVGLIQKVNMVGTLKQSGKDDIVEQINIDST